MAAGPAQTTPSMPTRKDDIDIGASRGAALKAALLAFMWLRLNASAAAALAVVLFSQPSDLPAHRQFVAPPLWSASGIDVGALRFYLVDVWARWDTNWYVSVARDGYRPGDGSSYRPPLYPAAIRSLSYPLGGDYLLAALAVSNATALGAFYLLARLGQQMGVSAGGPLYWLALTPTAFFFVAGYAESLFLLLALLAFREGFAGRLPTAGALASLATLTRWQGVALAPALVVLAARNLPLDLRRWHEWVASWPRLLAAGLPGLAFVAFAAYQSLSTGESGGVVGSTVAHWGFVYAWPWVVVGQAVGGLASGSAGLIEYLEMLALLVALPLSIVAARRMHLAYGVYLAATWTLYLTHVSSISPLTSLARLVILLFPVYLLRPSSSLERTLRALGLAAMPLSWLLIMAFALHLWVG